MKKKPVFYTELCYLFGILILALGASLLVKADFGVSVVVSPAYLLHLKLSETWSFFSFGIAEYVVQGTLLLLVILLVRRFHWSYLFSFVTALFYGFVLDRVLSVFALLSFQHLSLRIVFFLLGLLLCAIGVSLVLHTYLSPEVYELLIREVSACYRWNLGKVKTVYDCISCLIAISLSFAFFGLFHFHGIGIGTVISALVNGTLISLVSRFLESHFELCPAFPNIQHVFSSPPFPHTGKQASPEEDSLKHN
jgi:uncharacterized membrane protein YczE